MGANEEFRVLRLAVLAARPARSAWRLSRGGRPCTVGGSGGQSRARLAILGREARERVALYIHIYILYGTDIIDVSFKALAICVA